jgi:hypothetical protein
MSYGTIRLSSHTCIMHEDIMAEAKKPCKHIYGRAFVVNEINDNPPG